MRMLIVDPDGASRQQVLAKVRQIKSATVIGLCEDLTGAFDEVEHRVPDVVLVAGRLVLQPEFEMMEMLFRMVSARWLPIAGIRQFDLAGSYRGSLPPHFDCTEAVEVLEQKLWGKSGGALASLPSAKAGLLSSPGGNGAGRILLIGSSTGGVDALLRVLGSFPQDCPPTVIVQHTGSAFSAGLARLLDRNVSPNVREAKDGEMLQRGSVLLAPGAERHLVLEVSNGLCCKFKSGDRVSGHRPSVDALFQSAVPVARKVAAVVLTGMGKDGGEGLLALRKAGAETFAQDRETSLVYGMPRHAAEIGAASRILPLTAIGPALLQASQKLRA